MKVSLIILTFNRADTVKGAVGHNLEVARYPVHELIHVDNGSTDNVREVMDVFGPRTKVYHSTNRGVSRGYNAGYAMATGDFVCITGCDRIMPDGWLAAWVDCFEKIPNTGIISCYSCDISHVPERNRGFPSVIADIPIQPCMPLEARIMRRELFLEIGYLDEGFGLYAREDLCWAERAEKILTEKGLLSYTLPHFQAQHLGTEGVNEWDGKDHKLYHDFKRREVDNPASEARLVWNRANHYPKHNPFA